MKPKPVAWIRSGDDQLSLVKGKSDGYMIWKPLYSEAFVRQQQAEIENLKNANRFIQNFAEEQHQRAVALEMRELTDAEIIEIWSGMETDTGEQNIIFAREILRKASE